MKLLVNDELKEFVSAFVQDVDVKHIGETELDVRVGANFWHERDVHSAQSIQLLTNTETLIEEVFHKAPVQSHGIFLSPKQFVLVETHEKFKLPHDVLGLFTLRSWAAKAGLEQSSSLTLKPGWRGTLIMELYNCLHLHTLQIKPLEAIGQIQFFRIRS